MHPSNSYTKELEVCENSNNDIGPTFVHISLLPLLFNVPCSEDTYLTVNALGRFCIYCQVTPCIERAWTFKHR